MKQFMLLLSICTSNDSCQTFLQGIYDTKIECIREAAKYEGKISHAHCITLHGDDSSRLGAVR